LADQNKVLTFVKQTGVRKCDGGLTPTQKEKGSLKYIFGQGNHKPTGNRQFLRWNARKNVTPTLSFLKYCGCKKRETRKVH
jgi:hypothetical protein